MASFSISLSRGTVFCFVQCISWHAHVHVPEGRTKVEVARMIQSRKEDVTINYNKLHADPKQGKSLDIGQLLHNFPIKSCPANVILMFSLIRLVLKKVKHKIVENMNSGTADALGLSRAILCNGSSANFT